MLAVQSTEIVGDVVVVVDCEAPDCHPTSMMPSRMMPTTTTTTSSKRSKEQNDSSSFFVSVVSRVQQVLTSWPSFGGGEGIGSIHQDF